MKTTLLILLALSNVCAAQQDASPKPACRYHLEISRTGPATITHHGTSVKIETVGALKQYIETIAPGCRLAVMAFGDPNGESEFWHAIDELKALCDARHIKFRVLLE
jgi:hypothetical protein